MTVEDIREALRRLSDELAAVGEHGELIVVGGAAIALLLGGRDSTKDVDIYISKPMDNVVVRCAARRVASALELPDDWLNDGAKGFMHATEKGSCVFSGPNLSVFAVPIAQLLAMKCWAWRDEQDYQDAERLLACLVAEHEGASRQEVWEMTERFIPPSERTKPSYAFEDTWDRLHDAEA
jgi:hypothetical protein